MNKNVCIENVHMNASMFWLIEMIHLIYFYVLYK